MSFLGTTLFSWRAAKQSLQPIDDEQLLAKFYDAQHHASLALLIERYGDNLYHFLVTLSDAQLAEDASQTTWLKVIERRSLYQRLTASFKTWLFILGRNTLVDELRRVNRWVWQTLDEEPLLSDEDDVLEFIERADIQHQFDQALCSMPLLQRETLLLQLEGFSLQQIAVICNAIKPRKNEHAFCRCGSGLRTGT